MSSTRDNTYTNTNKRTFYLSDYVDNESISKLMWDILYQIREDDEKDEKHLLAKFTDWMKEKNYNTTKPLRLW